MVLTLMLMMVMRTVMTMAIKASDGARVLVDVVLLVVVLVDSGSLRATHFTCRMCSFFRVQVRHA